MSPQEFLSAWTGLDAEHRKKRLQWFASQDYKVQHDIVHRHLELVGTARNTKRWISSHPEDCTLGCLLQAIDEFWRIDHSDRIRNATGTELNAKDLADFGKIVTKRAKKSVKRERVAVHYNTIYKFRKEKGAWRAIAEYLNKHANLKVSHTYVQQVFEALAAERGEKDPFPAK